GAAAGVGGWPSAEGGRGRLQRLARDGSPLVAALAGGRRGGQAYAVVPARSLEPAAPLAASSWRLRWRRRSAAAAARPAGDRGWSPGRPALPTRPSGRCSTGRNLPP